MFLLEYDFKKHMPYYNQVRRGHHYKERCHGAFDSQEAHEDHHLSKFSCPDVALEPGATRVCVVLVLERSSSPEQPTSVEQPTHMSGARKKVLDVNNTSFNTNTSFNNNRKLMSQ
jgi:hypothetical protein